MLHHKKLFFALWTALSISTSGYSQGFEIKPKSLSLGGKGSIPLSFNFDGSTNLDLRLNPSIGYVVGKAWELGVEPVLNISIIKPVKVQNYIEWGINGYFRKHFLINDKLFYYIGVTIGSRVLDFDWKTWTGILGLDNGLLIGLAQNIALDIGIPINLLMDAYSGIRSLQMPMGYLGIKAYF